MASTYPTTIDAFTNPTTTDLLTSPSHAQQHSDINDAVEALQTKVAIGNTVLGTYTDYSATQTYSGITVGNGTTSSFYCRVNNFVHFHGSFTLGSTSAITGAVQISLPINLNSTMTGTGSPLGFAYYSDASAGTLFPADLIAAGSATFVYTSTWTASGSFVQRGNIQTTSPFTWAVSDRIYWNLYYKAA